MEKHSEILHEMHLYTYQNQLSLIKAFSINKVKSIVNFLITYFIYKFYSKQTNKQKCLKIVFCFIFLNVKLD